MYCEWGFTLLSRGWHSASLYLKASPRGVPSIMCLAQKWGHCTPFSSMSQIPWTGQSAQERPLDTYIQSVDADSEGEDENVPAGTEASYRVADEDESEEPEEGPDWVTTTRAEASTCSHLESCPETENQKQTFNRISYMVTVNAE